MPSPVSPKASAATNGHDGQLGTVAIETHGCKLNQADSAQLAEQFAAAGYLLASSNHNPDIIVVNTCTVTATADSKARQALRAARRSNPDAVLVAAGCYPQRAADELRRMPEVTLVVGNQDKPQLVALATSALAQLPRPAVQSERPTAGTGAIGVMRRSRASVKIQEGCDQVCAYCIVPRVRGRERSIPPDELVATVRRMAANGFREVVLTGTQLGTYGFDIAGADLAGLLDRILSETDVARLRVSSLQAHEISGELLARWQDSRLCPHFHVPLQSGCDGTLKAMRRRYDTAGFGRSLEQIRELVADVAVTTDIIVGFPGESEVDHESSVEFAAAMNFADIHVFPYSQRPGTSAHHFSGQVAAADKRRRAAEMGHVKAEAFARFRRAMTGQVREALWETARPGGENGRRWTGLTDNYVRVATITADDLANRITPVRLGRVEGSTMAGELLPR